MGVRCRHTRLWWRGVVGGRVSRRRIVLLRSVCRRILHSGEGKGGGRRGLFARVVVSLAAGDVDGSDVGGGWDDDGGGRVWECVGYDECFLQMTGERFRREGGRGRLGF